MWLLRIQMGSFYIESSKGFAKYNYLLDGVDESDHKRNDSSNKTGLLAGMESVQLSFNVSDTKRRSVVLTGATGFVGSMLLYDLLLHRAELHIESVIVLCRTKKGKTAAQRVEFLLNDTMFSFLTDGEKRTLIKVIEGDLVLPGAGLSDEAMNLLQQSSVTHIFNCAASVSFTQSLPEAATSNISSALNLQALGASISKERIQFVHLSTAFVHGGCCGSNGQPLPEALFSFGQFDPVKIYSSMTGTQFYASKAMNELSFPNTYTFSKCIAEHLLLISDPSTIIVRPSIIGPAVEFPYEGWAGRTPSTIVAAACLYLSYQWNIWCFGRHLVPIIPVDVVSRFVIGKAFSTNLLETVETYSVYESSSDESYDKVSRCSSSRWTPSSTSSSDGESGNQIFHATWDARSSCSSGFTWFEYAGAVTQVGCVTGYLSRSTAYLGLLVATHLIPRMKLTSHRFATLHDWCVKHPFDWMIQIRAKFGFSTSQMKRLHAYLNLPLLFYPFMNNSYYFQSELNAPLHLSGEHYLMICVSSAHNFIQKSREIRRQVDRQINQTTKMSCSCLSLLANIDLTSRVFGSSILWVISQPYGNAFVRVTAWLVFHVLKRCFTEISVDIQSFAPALLLQQESGFSCTILAPTHRSILDCLILTLVCFSVPELQLEMPSIAAAESFERIPLFGWLLRFLGAFFVRRGRMSVDPTLLDNVTAAKGKSNRPVVELFIEGTRSRDRRFLQPKTGVLRCINDPCCHQTIIPIVINYERIAEQESLVTEASGGLPSTLHLPAMISWLSVSLLFCVQCHPT
jgi:nucleoside-diphosphate-sugar epimerase/1-acyl-sn-glycerol-3-phosphate acyltransferase